MHFKLVAICELICYFCGAKVQINHYFLACFYPLHLSIMKKILLSLVAITLLNSCNDGDLTIDTINFDNAAAQECTLNNVVYKINGNQILLIEIPLSSLPYENKVGVKSFPINTTNRVLYRGYNNSVTGASICATIPPATPAVIEEWIAIAGTINISTTAIYNTPNPTTGAIKISKYRHSITFNNITFAKPSGNQVYETFVFGDFDTNANNLPMTFNPDSIQLCNSSNTLYNAQNGGIEGLFIQNISSNLLDTSILGTAKTALINTNNENILSYRLFSLALSLGGNSAYFCASPLPQNPLVKEEWTALAGVANTSGIIEVTTSTNGSGFSHSIRLKGVTFSNPSAGSTFYYGDDILIGTLLTN